jgi:hypothetical protein
MFSDGEKNVFHVQMGESKLYLMFIWGKIAIFHVQMGTTTLFTVQMGGGQQIEFTAQMGDNNSI